MKRVAYAPKYSLPIRICKIVRLVVSILIIVFALIILIFAQKSFTRTNFEYISKYLSIDPFITKSDYKNINLSYTEKTNFSTFDTNKIVIQTTNELTVFNMAGNVINKIRDSNCSYDSNGKYLCVINNDRTNASIYNSYIKINEIAANEGETFICVKSDSEGYITSVVRGNVSNCILTLYNNNFGAIYKWTSQNKYYVDSCINSKNKTISILTSEFKDGVDKYELNIISLKNGDVIKNITIEDENVNSMGYIKNQLVVMSNKSFKIYDSNYNLIKDTQIDGCIISCLFKNNIACVCKDTTGTYSVNVYAENGTLVSTSSYETAINNLYCIDQVYYVMCENNCLYKQTGYKVELVKEFDDVVVDTLNVSNNIMVCKSSGVEYLK